MRSSILCLDLAMGTSNTGFERTHRERDLYLRLLRLGFHTKLDPFRKEALPFVAERTGARHLYDPIQAFDLSQR